MGETKYTPGAWAQDASDYSWVLVDADGCFFRVARTADGEGGVRWVLAWTEEVTRQGVPGLRIGGSYRTEFAARRAVEGIAALSAATAPAEQDEEKT